jgi:hypothetical protein
MVIYLFLWLLIVMIWCMLEAYLVWLVFYLDMVYLGRLVE